MYTYLAVGGKLLNFGHMFTPPVSCAGSIPPELGNLAELEVLDLKWNKLTGAFVRVYGFFLCSMRPKKRLTTSLFVVD